MVAVVAGIPCAALDHMIELFIFGQNIWRFALHLFL